MTEGQTKRVVIVGAGITGLSTAYYLEQAAKKQGIALHITLVEADDKIGGKVQTEQVDGFVIEKGPDSFLARKVAAVNLCRELGIDDELVGTNQKAKKTYILHQGQLHRIPQGMNVGVPTQFMPFATTGLLSLGGKLRAGLDFVLPRRVEQGDQSLGLFLERRLGKEVVDHMAEPLLAGIYAGDLRNLSLRSTFPHLEDLERKYGSLVRGMVAQANAMKKQAAAKTPPKPELGAAPNAAAGTSAQAPKPLPNSVFLTFRTGLSRLIGAIREALTMTEIRTSTAVANVTPGGEEANYVVELVGGERLPVEAVIMTTPTYDAAKVLPDQFAQKAALLQVPYVSVANVVFAYKKGTIDYPLDASGFVVPKKEGRTITACTWTSSKWTHTATDGDVLLRFYVGRGGKEAIVEESDEEIIRRVRKDFADVMGIDREPHFARVTRWRRAMPQYTVGHLDRTKAFVQQAAQELPGVFFAGAGFTGLGIPDCIGQGIDTANETMAFLLK